MYVYYQCFRSDTMITNSNSNYINKIPPLVHIKSIHDSNIHIRL